MPPRRPLVIEDIFDLFETRIMEQYTALVVLFFAVLICKVTAFIDRL